MFKTDYVGMFPSNYVEFNDLSTNADTKWFKLWANAFKPKFNMQQNLFWETGKEKPVTAIGKLFLESIQVKIVSKYT